MTPTPRLTFQKGDFFSILLVVLLIVGTAAAFIPWNASSEDAVVQIWQAGSLIHEYPLTAQETIRLSGDYENTIVIHDGHVAIAESNCPGADCVHSGQIDRPGRSIVCLPNRVEVRIVGSSDVDFVVR
jgi:hypothetical protein